MPTLFAEASSSIGGGAFRQAAGRVAVTTADHVLEGWDGCCHVRGDMREDRLAPPLLQEHDEDPPGHLYLPRKALSAGGLLGWVYHWVDTTPWAPVRVQGTFPRLQRTRSIRCAFLVPFICAICCGVAGFGASRGATGEHQHLSYQRWTMG